MPKNKIQKRSDAIIAKLAKFMPDYETREAQQRLINGIAHITENSTNKKEPNHLIAECPTGSGKSLSSLIPAKAFKEILSEAGHDDISIIYATATVSLQQQLIKDVELLQKAGVKISAHVAVGRARFFCKKHATNLMTLAAENQDALDFEKGDDIDGDFDFPPEMNNINEGDKRKIDTLFKALDNGDWSGMRDDLSETLSINAQLWDKLRSDSNTCSSSCKFYSKHSCPFVKSRQSMEEADIVITNHALLFTDISRASVLPDIEKSMVILDEGHKAFDSFAAQQSSSVGIANLLKFSKKYSLLIANGMANLYKAAGNPAEASAQTVLNTFGELQRELSGFVTQLDSVFKHATAHQSKFEKDRGLWEMEAKHIHQYQLATSLSNIEGIASNIQGWMMRAVETAKKADLNESHDAVLAIMSEQIKVIEDTQKTVNYFLNADKYQPIALWCQSTGEGAMHYSLNASCIDMATPMKEQFWNRVKHCVLMSATLRTGGSFDRITNQLGVTKEMAYTLALPSPFEDAFNQSTLHLYPNFPDPDWRNTQSHSMAIANEVAGFMGYHQAGLLLVNSRKQMDEIVSMFPKHIASIALVQGGLVARKTLIEKHSKRIEEGQKSLLVGMASFAEGLDLKKELLTFVGICKLSFGQSSDPRTNAESKYLKTLGRNPFEEIILPETEKILQQSVGRLIRSINDRGEIAIFDSRCVKKQYGSAMINSLPNFYIQNNRIQQSA